MIPTFRLILLLLLPALPLAAAGFLPGLPFDIGIAAAVLLLAIVLAAAIADWLLAADLRRVAVQRDLNPKLSLGEWNPVRLAVANGASRPITLAIRDVVPPGIESDTGPSGPIVRGAVPAGGETVHTYRVRPPHRGDYLFGDLHLRAPGPLGLVVRQRRCAGTALPVRVYPSLRQLRRYDLLVRRGLMLEAGRRATRVPGAGTDFERLREYLPDDEFRRINWKATARRGRPIVNQFETERSQNLVILLDAGRLMGAPALPHLPAQSRRGEAFAHLAPGTSPVGRTAPSRAARPPRAHANGSPLRLTPQPFADSLAAGEAPAGLTKLDHAINTALLLAYVASQRDDRLALLAYADGIRTFLPPARGRRGVLRALHALYNLAAEPVEPDHALALQYLATHNLRRSLLVLFTDLADRESAAPLVAHLARAARTHQVVCVTLRDPAVVAPVRRPPHAAQDLYEQMVAQRLLDDRAATLATLRHRGVLTLDTDADTLSPQVISAYLDIKHRARV